MWPVREESLNSRNGAVGAIGPRRAPMKVRAKTLVRRLNDGVIFLRVLLEFGERKLANRLRSDYFRFDNDHTGEKNIIGRTDQSSIDKLIVK